jgi:hypothetical protein
MEDTKVEIVHYREVNKGGLKAFFTVEFGPYAQKVYDCRYFVMGEKQWVSFPQREISYTDGRKTEYFPYINFGDKAYFEQLKNKILDALETQTSEKQDGQTNNKTYSRKTNQVSPAPSASAQDLPF